MGDGSILLAADSLLAAFGPRTRLSTAELAEAAGGDEMLLTRALLFLRERDEVFTVAGSDLLYHRSNLVAEVTRALRTSGPRDAPGLSEELDLPVAIVCEVLGWLERAGTVTPLHEEERVAWRAV